MWVDEAAFLAASEDFAGCRFVTVGMDKVAFKKSVREGAILHFISTKTRLGTTSVAYEVRVLNQDEEIFSTCVTLVRIDEKGLKTALSKK